MMYASEIAGRVTGQIGIRARGNVKDMSRIGARQGRARGERVSEPSFGRISMRVGSITEIMAPGERGSRRRPGGPRRTCVRVDTAPTPSRQSKARHCSPGAGVTSCSGAMAHPIEATQARPGKARREKRARQEVWQGARRCDSAASRHDHAQAEDAGEPAKRDGQESANRRADERDRVGGRKR